MSLLSKPDYKVALMASTTFVQSVTGIIDLISVSLSVHYFFFFNIIWLSSAITKAVVFYTCTFKQVEAVKHIVASVWIVPKCCKAFDRQGVNIVLNLGGLDIIHVSKPALRCPRTVD